MLELLDALAPESQLTIPMLTLGGDRSARECESDGTDEFNDPQSVWTYCLVGTMGVVSPCDARGVAEGLHSG